MSPSSLSNSRNNCQSSAAKSCSPSGNGRTASPALLPLLDTQVAATAGWPTDTATRRRTRSGAMEARGPTHGRAPVVCHHVGLLHAEVVHESEHVTDQHRHHVVLDRPWPGGERPKPRRSGALARNRASTSAGVWGRTGPTSRGTRAGGAPAGLHPRRPRGGRPAPTPSLLSATGVESRHCRRRQVTYGNSRRRALARRASAVAGEPVDTGGSRGVTSTGRHESTGRSRHCTAPDIRRGRRCCRGSVTSDRQRHYRLPYRVGAAPSGTAPLAFPRCR